MSIEQTHAEIATPVAPQIVMHKVAWRRLFKGWLPWLFALWVSYVLIGGSALTAQEEQQRHLAMTVAGYGFDLFTWEIGAIGEKLQALIQQPARGLAYTEATQQVRTYLANAIKMYELEGKINRIFSENGGKPTDESVRLQKEVEALRTQQQSHRPTVEQIIEGQVGAELVKAGFQLGQLPMPPVQFTFVEPPKKLVVSPRDHIDTFYGQMLDAEISLDAMEKSEQRIRQEQDLSAYITNIGGLGAFPTMVVDRASLQWILSTVAHEWTHNYLSVFPLGFNYLTNGDMVTMNETVADIVGDEIGERTLRTFYPDLLRPPPPPDQESVTTPPQSEPPPFDFGAEMRKTRLRVDDLLAQGQVEKAERYMEARRLEFVKNGYPLRVLNQAYFAFHGSYGTSAASTSPIGPKMERLRTQSSDLYTFLTTVRNFRSVADLEKALGDETMTG